MKATLIEKRSFTLVSKSGAVIVVKMDLFKIPEINSKDYPQGYRFSWIAFNLDNPKERVLFDSHPPKGPHFHIGDEKDGTPFKWTSLEETEELFFKKVADHFGIEGDELQ